MLVHIKFLRDRINRVHQTGSETDPSIDQPLCKNVNLFLNVRKESGHLRANVIFDEFHVSPTIIKWLSSLHDLFSDADHNQKIYVKLELIKIGAICLVKTVEITNHYFPNPHCLLSQGNISTCASLYVAIQFGTKSQWFWHRKYISCYFLITANKSGIISSNLRDKRASPVFYLSVR